MLIKLFAVFALTTALVGPVSAASVEVRPFGEQDGQTVYALALAGDIKSGDDLRVASLLGKALVEDRFPGFMVLSSNGGNTNASLGIARIAHDYGIPVLVRVECLSGCAIIALSAWRGRLFVVESGAIGLHQSWVGEDSAKAIPSMEATQQGRSNTTGLRRAQVGRRENDANAAAGYHVPQRRRTKADRRAREAPSVKLCDRLFVRRDRRYGGRPPTSEIHQQHRRLDAFAGGVAQRATAAGCEQELSLLPLIVSQQLCRSHQNRHSCRPSLWSDRLGWRSILLGRHTTLSAPAVLAPNVVAGLCSCARSGRHQCAVPSDGCRSLQVEPTRPFNRDAKHSATASSKPSATRASTLRRRNCCCISRACSTSGSRMIAVTW